MEEYLKYDYTLNVPQYVGYWWMNDGEIKISTKTKPSFWKRFWFSYFFGVEWFSYFFGVEWFAISK